MMHDGGDDPGHLCGCQMSAENQQCSDLACSARARRTGTNRRDGEEPELAEPCGECGGGSHTDYEEGDEGGDLPVL